MKVADQSAVDDASILKGHNGSMSKSVVDQGAGVKMLLIDYGQGTHSDFKYG